MTKDKTPKNDQPKEEMFFINLLRKAGEPVAYLINLVFGGKSSDN